MLIFKYLESFTTFLKKMARIFFESHILYFMERRHYKMKEKELRKIVEFACNAI